MRSLAPAVLVAALLATGCAHRDRALSPADRKVCETVARKVGAPGSGGYKGVYDQCIRNVLHPERGGG